MASSNSAAPSVVEDAVANMSDEFREMFCEACKKHGEDGVAEGFCVSCVEYLCATCLKYHRRLMADHMLQDKNSMPQDFCFEKCPKHRNDIIKFYCLKCDTFLCSVCEQCNHRHCAKANHLSTIVKDVDNGMELSSYLEEVNILQQRVSMANKNIKVKYEETLLNRTTTKSAIKEHREKINSKLDMIEAELDNDIENIRQKNEAVIKSSDRHYSYLKCNLEFIQSCVNCDSVDRCKLFMSLKKAQKDIKSAESDMEQWIAGSKFTKCLFDSAAGVEEVLKTKDGFGNLISVDSERKRTAKYTTDINVNSTEDRHICDITGICVMSESSLIVADYENKLVKAIDVANNVVKSVIRVNDQPRDITKVSRQEVAVTLPNEQIIQIILFDNNEFLFEHRTIGVKGECWGIVYSQDHFITCFRYPPKMEIVDMSGNVLHRFAKDFSGKNLFICPRYLSVSLDHKYIYVSDPSDYAVKCLCRDGNVKSLYQADRKFPVGIAVDKNGAVFVCEWSSSTVQQLSDELSKVQVLLDKKRDLAMPRCCAICRITNKLYVGFEKGQKLKVFALG